MGKTDRKGMGKTALVFRSAKAAAVGLVFLLLLLLLEAIAVTQGKLTIEMSARIGLGAVVLSSVLSGTVLAKSVGQRALPMGALGGFSVALILMAASLLWPEGEASALLMVKLVICAVAGGAFGGALLIRPKRSKKRKR